MRAVLARVICDPQNTQKIPGTSFPTFVPSTAVNGVFMLRRLEMRALLC